MHPFLQTVQCGKMKKIQTKQKITAIFENRKKPGNNVEMIATVTAQSVQLAMYAKCSSVDHHQDVTVHKLVT